MIWLKMFTGIVAGLGQVSSVAGRRLAIHSAEIAPGAAAGESVAVNGVCLTICSLVAARNILEFDVSPETQQRTTLGKLTAGAYVNLERALAVGGLLGGHLMQGHVDTMGEVVSIQRQHDFFQFVFCVDERFDPLLVEKGSVAVDGISLTPFNIQRGRFEVAVIPHTFVNTTLREISTGAKVNVEFDILAKYVQKQLRKETTSNES